MTKKHTKICFLFPGQGAQYPGMAYDFIKNFPLARQIFEEADDHLKYRLSKIVNHGPEDVLTQTKNSQLGIFVASIAMMKVIKSTFAIDVSICAGLSLGEYTALHAAEWLNFTETLSLIQHRGSLMQAACENNKGSMAVILGLNADTVEEIVTKADLPNDLWVANFNCPGQVVISGTMKGIEIGTTLAKALGAKRVLPLNVQGAFHSGLMRSAEVKLTPFIMQAPFKIGRSQIVMNVVGDFVLDVNSVRTLLIQQVVNPVRWEQSIRSIQRNGVDLFVECGPGKTLTGLNKKIGVVVPSIAIENITDLEQLSALV